MGCRTPGDLVLLLGCFEDLLAKVGFDPKS